MSFLSFVFQFSFYWIKKQTHFFEPHFLRASQQFAENNGNGGDGQINEEMHPGDDDSNTSSVSRQHNIDDDEDGRDDMDDDDDDENDADSTNLPLNLVATQFAE